MRKLFEKLTSQLIGATCIYKKKKNNVTIVPESDTSPVTITLTGDTSDTLTLLLLIAISFKPNVSLHFLPFEKSEKPGTPLLQCGEDTVTGGSSDMLRYIDDRFPNPPLFVSGGLGVVGVVEVVKLQHRVILWWISELVTWACGMVTRGGDEIVEVGVMSKGMEVRKLGGKYSELLEVMLEHAQMEERVLFPVLEKADRGLSKAANKEHARDLPIMNGIKEYIKSIGVLKTEGSTYKDALFDLSTRLETLQEHCKEHFDEEERKLLPLLEGLDLSQELQKSMMRHCFEVMESTHSHLFRFVMEGLPPHDAMLYLILIIRYSDEERAVRILSSLLIKKKEITLPS